MDRSSQVSNTDNSLILQESGIKNEYVSLNQEGSQMFKIENTQQSSKQVMFLGDTRTVKDTEYSRNSNL